MNFIKVYDRTLQESRGPLKSASQSQQLRDKKQVQCKGLLNSKKKQNKGDAEKEQTDEKDEIYEMLHQLQEIDIVHSITIKKDAFFCITTTEEISQEKKQFYVGQTLLFLELTAQKLNSSKSF